MNSQHRVASRLRPGDSCQLRKRAENDRERELAKWLPSAREPDAAAGFRAGWRRLAQLMSPRFREWQRLWFEAKRDGDRLRAQVGVLQRDLTSLRDGVAGENQSWRPSFDARLRPGPAATNDDWNLRSCRQAAGHASGGLLMAAVTLSPVRAAAP